VARRVTGGIVISIAVVTLLGLLIPGEGGRTVTQLPARLVDLPASPAPVSQADVQLPDEQQRAAARAPAHPDAPDGRHVR
jgi:hypothetical protein